MQGDIELDLPDVDKFMEEASAAREFEQRKAAMQRLVDAISARRGDAEAAARVENSAYAWLNNPNWKGLDKEWHAAVGREAAAAYGDANPSLLLEAMEKQHGNELKEAGYTDGFERGRGDTWSRDEYCEQIGRLMQTLDASALKNTQEAQEAEDADSKALENYAKGGSPTNESYLYSDWAQLRSRMSSTEQGRKALENAHIIHELAATYFAPAFEKAKEDASEGLRMLDNLEDETLEAIGDDPERAAMVREILLSKAQELKESNAVGIGDEFVVAVGKKLANWGRFVKDKPTTLSYGLDAGLMATGAMPPIFKTGAQLERDAQKIKQENEAAEKKSIARGLLREAVNAGMEKSDTVGFWKGMMRSVASFSGDTAPYLVPYVGQVFGTADQVVQGMTETYDVYRAQGLSPEEAAGQSLIDTSVNASVELLPFSEVGGAGLSKLVRRAMKGKPGALARGLAKATQTSVGKALAWEAGVGFIDEAVLEPIAGGLMQYGAEQLFDFAGWKHDKSKAFVECFDELKQIWTDPQQLAGLVLFSGMVASGGAPHIIQNVRYFQANRNMLYSRGLSEKEIDTAMASGNAALAAAQMEREKWQADPEGMKKLVLERNAELQQSGQALVYAGLGEMAQGFDARFNEEMGTAWKEYAKEGVLPRVEEAENGKIKITERGGGQEHVMEMDGSTADFYLSQRIAELEKRELARVRRRVKNAPADSVNLRAAILDKVSRKMGAELLEGVKESEAQSGISVKSLTEGLPEEMKNRIEAKGYVDWSEAQAITEYGMGQVRALMEGGLSEEQARGSRAAVMGGVRTWGDIAGFAAAFAHRAQMAGISPQEAATSVYRANGEKKIIDGDSVAGQVIFAVPGASRASSVLEDTVEAVFAQMLDARARELAQADDVTSAQAKAQALEEMADLVSRARDAVLKADSQAKIEEVRPGDMMSVIEAFSTMATSSFMDSAIMPAWMRPLAQLSKGVVQTADALGRIKQAYEAAMQQDGDAMRAMDELLGSVGVKVQSVFARAHAEARVQVAESVERAKYADAPGRTAAEVVEEVQRETEAIEEREKHVPEPAVTQEEYTRDVQRDLEEMEQKAQLSGKWKDIFVDGRGMRHPIGGYMLGLVDKSKITGQIEQVKRGEKGEHGTMVGRRLKGDFQGDAGALYLWLRKDGSLWLISGRHRYDLLMQDEKMPYHVAYVYEEDETHNETWARMLDYENNMRDDQADELTAATYVREMKPTDEELYSKGLTRNESRSARGVYIGRQAGQFLWDLFNNGQIKGKRAAENVETICKMTEYIRDEEVRNNVQAMAAKLLADGESWECINVCIQAMAADKNAPKEGRMRQGFLFFGKDFEEEMRQRGRYAARAIAALSEKINAGTGAAKAQKNAAAVAEMGYTVTRSEGEQKYTLEELVALRERFRNMALDPELTEDALAWDGQSAIDPIERYITSRREELDAQEAEEERQKNLEAEEYLDEHMGSLFGGGAESFSIQIAAERVCRTRKEANNLVGRNKKAISLSNKYLELEAEYNAKSEGKAASSDSLDKTFAALEPLGMKRDDILKIHYTAIGNIVDLFSNAERMQFERAYKKQESRKGVLHVYSPFTISGESGEFEANIELLIHQDTGRKPTAYVLSVEVNKKLPPIIGRSEAPFNLPAAAHELTFGKEASVPPMSSVVADIQAEFPEIVKEKNSKEHDSLELAEAKKRGLFKDGVMATANAIITEPGVSFAIRGAQHTSPHLFKYFDLEHIGTGEGAQAYGYGVYFSSNWGTNKNYFDGFSNRTYVFSSNKGDIGAKDVLKILKKYHDNVTEHTVVNFIPGSIDEYDRRIKDSERAIKLAEYLKDEKIVYDKSDDRRVFFRNEVEISYKDVMYIFRDFGFTYNFIDFLVRDSIDGYANYIEKERASIKENKELKRKGIVKQKAMNYLSDLEVEEHELLDWDKMMVYGARADFPETEPGGVQFSPLGDALGKRVSGAYTGAEIYKKLVKKLGSPEAASMWLLERGIKGIRYADGMSRGKDGKKTYNYVIWDMDAIKTRKVAVRKPWSSDVNDASIWQDWESWKDSFSMFSPAEISGLKALRAVADGAQEARFRSDTLGQDVILPLGNAGVYKDANNPKSRVVGAYGLVHLITMRMAHGESLEEAAYTASKAIMAAVNGEIVPERSNKLRKILTLDDYACAVNVTWDGQQSAWVITGYRQNGKKSDADARRKAMYLAEGYAPDSFVRLKEVGAALDYAIARLAREYKQNHADGRRKLSVAEAKEAGMFKDGVMETANAIITEPGVSFAILGAQHTSPYLFKYFGLEHIGTGVGAQAYGYGVYFSENWDVNRNYYDHFEDIQGHAIKKHNGEEVNDEYLNLIAKEIGVSLKTLKLNIVLAFSAEEARSDYSKSIEHLRHVVSQYEEMRKKGRSFTEHYFTEDKERLRIKERLAEEGIYESRPIPPMNYLSDLMVDDKELIIWDRRLSTSIQKKFADIGYVHTDGEALYDSLKRRFGSAQAASKCLLERGIKGMRYYDELSRGKRKKTCNYVIWDPAVIQVKKVAVRKPWSSDVNDASIWQDWESWKDSFSMSPTLRQDIHAAYTNRTRKDALIPLCSSPRVFGLLGLEVADIVTEARTIRKLYGKGLSEEEIVRAVELFDDALAIIKDSESSVILLPGMLASNKKGEQADVQAAIRLQRADDGRHYMASLYALDNYQKIEAQLKQGHLIYSKYTKEDLEANNGALGQKTGVSPTLVRLLTSQGLSEGNVTTGADIVKLENEMRESFAMGRAAEMAAARKVNDILLGRAGEREGEAVMKQWGDWMERIARVSAAGEGKSRLGRGVEALAGLVSLVGATQSVLPERYKTPSLRVQMAFATWYARMIETGSIEASEELAGDKFYERYKARFAADVELQKSYGVDEEGAREYLADIVGGRFDGVMLNVARRCRKSIEKFMKDRVRERMDALRARLYPKRKSGQAWPRGKADAETYRWVEEVYALMEHKDNEQGEPGDFEAETERLELLLEDLEQDGEGESEKAAALREQVHMRQVFGQWRKLSYEAAEVAGEEFEARVLEGRRTWEERLETQRRHVAWLKEQVRHAPGRDREWKLAGSPEAIAEQVRSSAQKNGRFKDLRHDAIGMYTSFAGKMKTWAPELGGVFTERMTRDWANMNISLKSRNDETLRFVQKVVAKASGAKTLEGMAQWIREQSALEKTGIILHRRATKSKSYTAEQAGLWLGLETYQEREAKRAEMRREAEEQEVTAAIPTEEDVKRMRELYEQKPDRKTYAFESEEAQEWELEASKLGVLQNIMLFEQEQYRELWDVNGIDEATLARMREYVGADMLELGYALRDRLAEMRPELAAKYEATYGIPFASVENYYPARFLVESKGVADEQGQVKKNKGGMPAKPGFLVPRQKHQRIADWGVSALDTFFGAAAAQNNWLVTSDFIGLWGALFADKKFSAELEVNCGKNFGAWVKADILTLAGAGMEDARLLSSLNRIISRVGRGMAITALSYNGTTIFKNTLSLLNGMTGARAPIVKLQESGAARVLSARRIGWAEWLAGFARGPFGVREIAQQEFIKVRSGLYSENLRRAAKEPAERKGKLAKLMPRGVGKLGQIGLTVQNAGMAPIEWADVGGNVISCVAVANAVYNSLEQQDTQGVMSEEQKRELALQYAAMCLDAVAQPFIASQKTTGAARRLIFGATGDVVQYMFKSEAMAKVSDAVADIATGTPSGIAHGVASLTLHGGAAVLMGALYLQAMRWIYALITGDEPEEEKDYWEKIATDAAFAGVYDVPLVGAGAEELVNAATGRRTYYSQNVLGNAVRAGGRLFDSKKEYSRAKQIKDVSTMLKAAGQAGVFFGNVRPVSTLTELTLAAGAVSNIPAKVAAGSGKKR